MLRRGIAVICRTKEEQDAICKVIDKEGYGFQGMEKAEDIIYRCLPIRISFNTTSYHNNNRCCTYCADIDYPVNPGITEVYEASKLLHNVIIQERIRKG